MLPSAVEHSVDKPTRLNICEIQPKFPKKTEAAMLSSIVVRTKKEKAPLQAHRLLSHSYLSTHITLQKAFHGDSATYQNIAAVVLM